MTAKQEAPTPSPLGPLARYEQNVIDRIKDFNDPRQEWRRLFSELLGTFFLVLAAAGGGMMSHAFPGVISHTAAVTAPALTVMGIILYMGKISGAHLRTRPGLHHLHQLLGLHRRADRRRRDRRGNRLCPTRPGR